MSVGVRSARALLAWHLLVLGVVAGCWWLMAASVDRIRQDSVTIVLLFLINGTVAVYSLVQSNLFDGISLRVMFWFHALFFLSVVPLAQYLTATNWIFTVSERSILEANLCVLVYSVTFLLTYPRGRALAKDRIVHAHPKTARVFSTRRSVVLGLVGLCGLFVLLSNVDFVWGRSLAALTFGVAGPQAYLGGFVLRPACFFLALLAVMSFRLLSRPRAEHYLALIVAAIVGVVLNFPSGGTRFYTFATWFGFFIVIYPPRRGRHLVFLVLLLAGIYGSYLVTLMAQSFTAQAIPATVAEYVYQGHFDGFENLVHGIDFVRDEGTAWGRQLLGVMLFWVPRELWPEKPIGTAAHVALSYVSKTDVVHYSNLASPFIEEAYVNFSMIGVVMFTAALGWSFGYFDAMYQAHLKTVPTVRGVHRSIVTQGFMRYMVLYPVIVGLALYFLRGDMLSSVSYSAGIVAGYEIISRLVIVRA